MPNSCLLLSKWNVSCAISFLCAQPDMCSFSLNWEFFFCSYIEHWMCTHYIIPRVLCIDILSEKEYKYFYIESIVFGCVVLSRNCKQSEIIRQVCYCLLNQMNINYRIYWNVIILADEFWCKFDWLFTTIRLIESIMPRAKARV